jgi:SARP family transcriptional regulator, regulator of embCAB operon
MREDDACRLQVCGPLHACLRGEDITHRLPLGQAQAIFAFLVLHRDRSWSRSELVDAMWPISPPARADRDIAALLSRIRAVVGAGVLPVGTLVRLHLPVAAEVDLEVALDSIDRAEAAVHRSEWTTAWVAGKSALAIARRGFLPEVRLPWAERQRARLRDITLRGYEVVGESGLGIGGPQLAAAQRLGMEIIAEEPMRESGYRLVMRACVARGNHAEAVQVYDRMRRRLADELGLDPGPQSRALFDAVLAQSRADPDR